MTTSISLKQNLFDTCKQLLNDRIENLTKDIKNLRDGIANDSKSSMGDKYETSREMSQQEINRLEQQLSNNKQLLFYLNAIDVNKKSKSIIVGSLVETNIGKFFIAISFGDLKIENQSFFLISPASPIGQLLLGKFVGDEFNMNNKKIKISAIN